MPSNSASSLACAAEDTLFKRKPIFYHWFSLQLYKEYGKVWTGNSTEMEVTVGRRIFKIATRKVEKAMNECKKANLSNQDEYIVGLWSSKELVKQELTFTGL